MAWVMSVSGISATITHFLESVVNGHTLVFLLIANILVLIAGCFIDGNSIMYIFVPIFMPIATALGVDLYHLGVVLVMNVAIGQVTPPVGCNLFVACGIGRHSGRGHRPAGCALYHRLCHCAADRNTGSGRQHPAARAARLIPGIYPFA